MELRFGFVGFGNVARAFARMLHSNAPRLAGESGLRWRTTAIATANHGCVLSDSCIDLNDAADLCENGGSLLELPATIDCGDAESLIDRCEADVIFETTPLNPQEGEPATSYIRSALDRAIKIEDGDATLGAEHGATRADELIPTLAIDAVRLAPGNVAPKAVFGRSREHALPYPDLFLPEPAEVEWDRPAAVADVDHPAGDRRDGQSD